MRCFGTVGLSIGPTYFPTNNGFDHGPTDRQCAMSALNEDLPIETIQLRWSGPFSFTSRRPPSILEAPESDTAGIYVWLVRTNSGPRLHYVGEAGLSIARRHVEHFESYVTGRYSVRDAEAMRDGKQEYLHQGGYWRKRPPAEKQDFVDRFAEFAPHIVGMLELIDVYIAPMAGSQRLRRRVEGGLVTGLYAEATVDRALFPAGLLVWKRRVDEPPVEVTVENPPPIEGFPRRAEV